MPVKPGDRRCEFCGTKIPAEGVETVPVAVGRDRGRVARLADWLSFAPTRETLEAVGIAFLVVATIFVVQRYAGAGREPAGPARIETDDNHAAFRACELVVRQQAGALFTVKSFSSALVAKEKGGYAVSGTVELQNGSGAVLKKRYSCKVHPDARSGMVVDQGSFD